MGSKGVIVQLFASQAIANWEITVADAVHRRSVIKALGVRGAECHMRAAVAANNV